jgi:hypothetical protein
MTEETAKQLLQKLAEAKKTAGLKDTLSALATKGTALAREGLDLAAYVPGVVASKVDKLAPRTPTDTKTMSALEAVRDAQNANRQAYNNAMTRDDWAKLFTASLGAGAAVSGVKSYNMMAQDRKKRRDPSYVEELPIPYREAKTAYNLLQDAIGGAYNAVITPDKDVKTRFDSSTYFPGAVAAVIGGLYGSGALAQAVTSRLRARRNEADLDKKRQALKQEMLSLYDKTAEALDTCFDAFKAGEGEPGPSYISGNAIRNAILTASVIAAPIGFSQQYRQSSKLDEIKAVQDAMKMRARMRESQQPSDLYATLEPVEAKKKKQLALEV